MKRWISFAVAGLACALAALGCSPNLRGTACAGDDDCIAGEICVSSKCTPVDCVRDADCAEGETCVDHECVAGGECDSDGQCEAGNVCVDHQCTPGCRADGDCPTGMFCIPEQGEHGDCVECREDSHCPPGHDCVDFQCVPQSQECDALAVIPPVLDFGEVVVGCSSPERVAIYNIGAVPRTIPGIYLEDPLDPAFEIRQAPVTPFVLQGGDHVEVGLRYSPQALGPHAGGLIVECGQADEGRLFVPLVGAGVDYPDVLDTFELPDEAMVDVLFVVDNSSSMMPAQEALADNFAAFIGWAIQLGVDFHIGVVTTDMDDLAQQGRLQGEPRIITAGTPDPEQAFSVNVRVGTDGSPIECGLAASRAALSEPLLTGHNAGFLRDRAKLSVIYVSDEDDSSPSSTDFYFDYFYFVHFKGCLDKLILSSICGDVPLGCTGQWGLAEPGVRYVDMVDMSGGLFQSICEDDWSVMMQELGEYLFAPRRSFVLSRTADPATILVNVDGAFVPEAGSNGWTFTAEFNAIWFGDNAVPPYGSTVQVFYTALCR